MLAILAGLAAGAIHVLSGPDHLAAVAPLTVEGRRRPWLTGFWWGTGHSSGVWIVGLLALALREVLPLEAMSSWSERLVGVVLIGIGLWGLRKAFSRHLHAHEHTHDGVRHTHFHLHPEAIKDAPADEINLAENAAVRPAHQDRPHAHTHAALFVGILHGLAGSSHFLGVLPALALPSRAAALGYIIAFGLGSIAAMTAFSWAFGLLATRLGGGIKPYRWLMTGCCLAAIGVGGFWLIT